MFLTRVEIENATREASLRLFSQIEGTGVYVDIGCEGPGSTPSMPCDTIKNSKLALLLEPRDEYFNETKIYYRDHSNIIVRDGFVTPDNISTTIIEPLGKEKDNVFVMDIDIDGYDFYLAESLLKANIKPIFLSMEINEKIPPPLKFSILYSELYKFPDGHFYGASISKIEELTQYGYDLIQLFFNSIILVRRDKNPYYADNERYKSFKPRTALELYSTQYIDNNLYKHVEHNMDVSHWQDIKDVDLLIKEINERFKHHINEYELYI